MANRVPFLVAEMGPNVDIGRMTQVERGAINVPWLRPTAREFVNLGNDCKDQGRNTVARLFCHFSLRRALADLPRSMQCTVSGG